MRSIFLAAAALTLLAAQATAQHMNAKGAPCQQPAANAETGQCFFSAAKKADENLNRTYSKIQAFFESQKRIADKDALRNAQRLWIGFRDANCAAERDLYKGGTAAPLNYSACMESLTRQRAEDLETGFGWLLEK